MFAKSKFIISPALVYEHYILKSGIFVKAMPDNINFKKNG